MISVLNKDRHTAIRKNLIPPAVEPEQPPKAQIMINKMVAREFQFEKSSRLKHVDEITVITLKKANLKAGSIS